MGQPFGQIIKPVVLLLAAGLAGLVGGWPGVPVALLGGAGQPLAAQPGPAVSGLPVMKLLGPRKTTIAEMRDEQPRLLAARPAWQADPVARFLIDRRLSFNYYDLLSLDSAYHFLHRARVAGAALPARYGPDVCQVSARLADYHYRRARYDSAHFYYNEQARQLRRSGASLTSPDPVVLLEGPSDLRLGLTLAQADANAGLALRRSGDLAGPVRYYDRAIRQFEAVRYAPGTVWARELLGEAYEEQGNDRKAAAAYESAVRAARADYAARSPRNRVDALEAFSEVLIYYEPLLLRLRRPDRLLALAREGLAKAEPVLAIEGRTGHARDVLNVIASLRLHAARAQVVAGEWGAATTLLDQAAADLSRLAAVSAAVNRQELHYYEKQVRLHTLRAVLEYERGAKPRQAREQAIARGYLDSLAYPAARLQTTFQLAAQLSQLHEYAAARELLAPLVPQFRAANNRLQLREVYRLLARAYAGQGQYEAAYAAKERYEGLNDSLRAAQQYAALADVETRYQTEQKEARIGQLTTESAQQRRQNQLAWLSALLLLTLLGGVAWVLRRTRRLNRRLARQHAQIQRQAEQLAELDRAKSQFFANVSHELRTPLTLVLGPVEQLLHERGGRLDEDVRSRLALSVRNGRRLQRLVNGILDLTKLAAGKLEVRAAPVQAASFFRQLVAVFESLAHERRIGLTSHIDLPEALTLQLDADKAEKVITNLLANALKFTPAGGRVHLEARPAGEPGHYCVRVRDTGPGIAPDEQGRVFERFYQSRHLQAQGGTGLGLALSRELAELLGGTLTLASTPGEGSTFTFTFRAETVASREPALVKQPSPDAHPGVLPAPGSGVELVETGEGGAAGAWDGRRPRLLVVEDNADLRAYLRQILEPHYHVLEAEHGRQALEILAREEVDLVSSDAMMPEMGGVELLGHVKAHPRWRRLPFLMLTARAEAEHRLSALELGVDDYLPKPFLARELLARVRNLLVNYYERLRWQTGPDPEPLPAGAAEEGAVEEGAVETDVEERDAAEAEGARAPAVATAPAPAAVAEAPGEAPGVAPDPALLAALQALIPAVLSNPDYTPALLADELRLSERTLYRKLKEQTGLTPAGWLREVRLDHARQLLESQTLATVAEVAYAAGFQDPNYFGQAFTKRFGRRPSEY